MTKIITSQFLVPGSIISRETLVSMKQNWNAWVCIPLGECCPEEDVALSMDECDLKHHEGVLLFSH